MRRRLQLGLALSFAVLVLGACASPRPVVQALPTTSAEAGDAARTALSDDALWKLYEEAVDAARYPQASAVSTSLVPIQRTTPGLQWDSQGRVLMATWTKAQYYQGAEGQERTFSHGDVWLTAVPFVQAFCRALDLPPDQLTLRLEQLLGLPPNAGYDAFVQLWIDPRAFFRPCADPEIVDQECTVNLSVDPSPPPGCPWAGAYASQTGANWVSVTQAHLDWMCANWTKTYVPDPRQSYPWTALGYTYDWGGRDPVGESEFVAPKGTTVLIDSVTPTAEYCREDGSSPPEVTAKELAAVLLAEPAAEPEPTRFVVSAEELEEIRSVVLRYYRQEKPRRWEAFAEELREGWITQEGDFRPGLSPSFGGWQFGAVDGRFVLVRQPPMPDEMPTLLVYFGVYLAKENGVWRVTGEYELQQRIGPAS